MEITQYGFRKRMLDTLLTAQRGSRDAPAWQLSEVNPGISHLTTDHGRYRIGRKRVLGLGFSEYLLGAAYGYVWDNRAERTAKLDAELFNLLEREKTRGRFALIVQENPADEDHGVRLPLFTVFKSPSGKSFVLEFNEKGLSSEPMHAFLLLYGYVLAAAEFSISRYDADADFLELGSPNIVQRHSTERLRKHIAYRVKVTRELCNDCLICVTSCAEMKAVPSTKGTVLLGPAEAHCTNCGLCQQRCPLLTPVLKEEAALANASEVSGVQGGEPLIISGLQSAALVDWLAKSSDDPSANPLVQMEKAADIIWQPPGKAAVRLQQYSCQASETSLFPRPLLITSFSANGSSSSRTILRLHARAVVFLTTETGAMEAEMALAALKSGARVWGVVDPARRAAVVAGNIALQQLQANDHVHEEDSLEDLVSANEVDVVLTPFLERISKKVHTKMLERDGSTARIMAPQIFQAFTLANDPLLDELRQELLDIFSRHPEALEAEARLARSYLQDIEGSSAHIHARYRSMAMASGHSACPTCAELQVLAVPLYMAILFSLARGEVPEVTFTCETGCMSETLNKVKEVAQKVRGGRTVFGGGFAFGEAVAMAEEFGVKSGHLPKQRRYVVSQSGDGGSVIGLPAWLNALRQKAFLVPQRHANVLHFINITDTQVYSNTGGESSASSMLGMGTLTTPIGQFLLGNQRIQWNLINLAAEFPGILVGTGHSADKTDMQKFWHQADLMGRSAIRWDVTPCPETGKFFGEDPDRLAMIMAHAGMLPQVLFVGRLRKRTAPINPEDRFKPWMQWRNKPRPILSWLQHDRRYSALFHRDPHSGELQPRNAAVSLVVALLERYRDQLNLEIDLESRLVRQAEDQVETFFQHLQQQWQRNQHDLDLFPYRFLFDATGELKPEYRASLKHEMTEFILNGEALRQYQDARAAAAPKQSRLLQELHEHLQRIEPLLHTQEELPPEEKQVLEKIATLAEDLQECGQESLARIEAALQQTGDAAAATAEAAASAPANNGLYRVLDRLLEDRALAKQAEILQAAQAARLRHSFLEKGGLIQATSSAGDSLERAKLRGVIRELGPFAIAVASLAGERGIAINRIFSNLFTAKGAWAGMAWQFGSSKRGTPVLSATFVSAEPIERKDAMYSFPYFILTVTNYGDLKSNPELFFDNLDPEGYLIINSRKAPQDIREELLHSYDADLQQLVAQIAESPAPRAELAEWTSQTLYQMSYHSLPSEQQRQVRKCLAMARANLISVDMEGIIQEVTGSERAVANLVAVGPMLKALQHLGLPLDLDTDLQPLLSGFPGAVLKNKTLLEHYLKAIRIAIKKSQGFPAAAPRPLSVEEKPLPSADPGTHLMAMGGTVAGMVLSQLATAEHPLCYVGFPITPAGNPFYAMAEAFANGHPYIYVDEMNPSEKVAAEKLIGIARTGGMLPVTFTASQGWRLFTEIIPQFVGARLEGIFLITKRALAAPALNIEESHTDFMSFRDDGGIMLAPKSVQEYVPALYLARLMTHFAKLPVILSIGGITDTHKIGLIRVPPDQAVRSWLAEVLQDFDFLEHKLLNRQGDILVHGPSATAEFYQETQSEVERAHRAAMEVMPYAVQAVKKLTGYTFDELETAVAGSEKEMRTVLVLQGSLYPNAVEAVRELEAAGWRGLGCLSVRWFNPFPTEKLAQALRQVERIIVLDRSNSFGSEPPLASRVLNLLVRRDRGARPIVQLLVGGLGGREITVAEMKDILTFAHLILHRPQSGEKKMLKTLLHQDAHLQTMLEELAALQQRTIERHTRVPPHLRRASKVSSELQSRRRILVQLLGQKQYSKLLANYGAVGFVGAKEALGETELLKSTICRLEILAARKYLQAGTADPRRALILLHYSSEVEDWQLAAGTFRRLFEQQAAASGTITAKLLHSYSGKLARLDLPPNLLAAVPEEAALAATPVQPTDEQASSDTLSPAALETTAEDAGAADQQPQLSPSVGEMELIRSIMSQLVHEDAARGLCYNPEDFIRALSNLLINDSRSQLHDCAKSGNSQLVAAYHRLYEPFIYRTMHREILMQNLAPEIEKIFEGEGANAIELVLQGAMIEAQAKAAAELPADSLIQVGLQAVRAYLQQRVLPGQPKRPAFYLDYFTAVAEPELREKAREMLAQGLRRSTAAA
ncbi:MAG: 2-oxoacid:acceptor oxidoreductase family protein [Deltaproteobacteria bacterium]|nr:2-oxoacid:acceptor oxidoreductase family protein [Deltaproteobacteria bacterium]